MKKIIAVLLVLVLAVTLFACASNKGETNDGILGGGSETTVMSNENVNIDGIYVDSSYSDKEGSSLKLVYLFLTVTATDTNLKVDNKYMKMKINDANVYESENIPGACNYASSYYYSAYIEDVYVGENIKLALTFKVPEGDLTGGKKITFEDSAIPVNDLRITTDDLVFCEQSEQLFEKADPSGYAAEMDKRNPADDATAKKVKNEINGYYWTFYVNSTTYELEFFSGNKFEVRTSLGTAQQGTYTVQKGYIFCTYPNTGYTVEVPYEFADGEFKLDAVSAFDVN